MVINLNYEQVEIAANSTVAQVITKFNLTNIDLININGVNCQSTAILAPNDNLLALNKAAILDSDLIAKATMARNDTSLINYFLKLNIVICGCGGIGSNIARMATQLGIGNITLIDFDLVDPTNLNRQMYTINHIGQPKIYVLQQYLQQINPRLNVKTIDTTITADNIDRLISGYDFVFEGFDTPHMKALIVQSAMRTKAQLICANGMAGIKPASKITTRQISQNIYMCGDFYSNVQPHEGLMAPQVNLVASHMVNKLLELCKERNNNE